MIVQIRGESGSGKSHLVRQLIRNFHGEVIVQHHAPEFRRSDGGRVRVDVWQLDGGLYVLGTYDMETGTGSGADKINGPVGIEMIRHYAGIAHERGHHLVWESKRGSSYTASKEYLTLAHTFEIVWATLDTPFDIARDRVTNDRGGGFKNLKKQKTQHLWVQNRTVEVAQAAWIRCEWLDHLNAYEQLVALLRQGGWDPDSYAGSSAGPT